MKLKSCINYDFRRTNHKKNYKYDEGDQNENDPSYLLIKRGHRSIRKAKENMWNTLIRYGGGKLHHATQHRNPFHLYADSPKRRRNGAQYFAPNFIPDSISNELREYNLDVKHYTEFSCLDWTNNHALTKHNNPQCPRYNSLEIMAERIIILAY